MWPCNFLATQRHCGKGHREGARRDSKNKPLRGGEETLSLARNKEGHTLGTGKMERTPFTTGNSVSAVCDLWDSEKVGQAVRAVDQWLRTWGSNTEHLLCSLRAGARQKTGLETKHSKTIHVFGHGEWGNRLSQDGGFGCRGGSDPDTSPNHVIHTTVDSSMFTKLNVTVCQELEGRALSGLVGWIFPNVKTLFEVYAQQLLSQNRPCLHHPLSRADWTRGGHLTQDVPISFPFLGIGN